MWGPLHSRAGFTLWRHGRADGLTDFFLPHPTPKNFTALIPGTTVEILHGDSKNIIQLIINAYSVSHPFLPNPHLHPHPLPLRLWELPGLRWAVHHTGMLGSASRLLPGCLPGKSQQVCRQVGCFPPLLRFGVEKAIWLEASPALPSANLTLISWSL